jgi:hypothetical protein
MPGAPPGRDPVGEAEYGLHVVFDQHNGAPAFKRFEQAHDAHSFLGSHPRHRLVEQQDPRAGRQRKTELELPALAMRQRPGELVGAGAEPNGVELGACPIPVIRAASPLESKRQVFLHRKVRKHAGDLIRACQPEPDAPVHGEAGDVTAVEHDRAGARAERA